MDRVSSGMDMHKKPRQTPSATSITILLWVKTRQTKGVRNVRDEKYRSASRVRLERVSCGHGSQFFINDIQNSFGSRKQLQQRKGYEHRGN